LLKNAIIGKLNVLDDEIDAATSLEQAAILDHTNIDRSRFSGNLDLHGAALSVTQVTHNKFSSDVIFDNVLSFNKTTGENVIFGIEVRCGFNFSNNNIASDLILAHLKFYNTRVAGLIPLYSWPAARSNDVGKRLEEFFTPNGGSAISAEMDVMRHTLLHAAGHTDCKSELPVASEAVRFNDNKVEKNICIREFEFSRGGAPEVKSPSVNDDRNRVGALVSFAGSAVAGTTYLARWPDGSDAAYRVRVVDLVGFQTGGLALALKDNHDAEPQFLTTGMRFDRIFGSERDCSIEQRSLDGGSSASTGAMLEPPDKGRLLKWLEKVDTTQPYTAAIGALERAGADAVDLKIQKAYAELTGEVREKWQEFIGAWRDRQGLNWLWQRGPERLWDYLRLILTQMLGWVADYGYRPQKAILFVAVAVTCFTMWISEGLNVKSAVTEIQDRTISIGWVFVLDHMIPGYNIDEAHFKVRQFRFANGEEIDADTKRRLYNSLRWAKVTGAVAAIFIAAALKNLAVG